MRFNVKICDRIIIRTKQVSQSGIQRTTFHSFYMCGKLISSTAPDRLKKGCRLETNGVFIHSTGKGLYIRKGRF